MNNEKDVRKQELNQEIINLQEHLTSNTSPLGDWKMIKYQEYEICGADYQWIDYVMSGQPYEIQIFSDAIKKSNKFHVEFKIKSENVIIDYVAF